MDIIKDILRQYGANILACLVFAVAAVRFWWLGGCLNFESNHLRDFILAFAGLMAFVASDQWSDWTGQYGFTRKQWLAAPSSLIRLVGGIALVYFTVALFRR